MSGRYVNKSIRKDIYSNSGAVATAKFVDFKNLELLGSNTDNTSVVFDVPVTLPVSTNVYVLSNPRVYNTSQTLSSPSFYLVNNFLYKSNGAGADTKVIAAPFCPAAVLFTGIFSLQAGASSPNLQVNVVYDIDISGNLAVAPPNKLYASYDDPVTFTGSFNNAVYKVNGETFVSPAGSVIYDTTYGGQLLFSPSNSSTGRWERY